MNFLASVVAKWVEGELFGEDRPITGVSPLESARRHDLTYSTGTKVSLGVTLVKTPQPGSVCIVVENPRASFAKALDHIFPEIHPSGNMSSFVDPSAEIAEDACIYPGVWIGKDCRVGSGTVIFPNAVILPNVWIGKNCRIHSGAVLGSEGFAFERTPDELVKIPQIGRLRIEDGVEIGANCCVDRGGLGETLISSNVKIDNLVQVAHNVQIGEGSLIAAQSGIAGSAEIGRHVLIGGQVGVSDHARIGDLAEIAAKSGVHGKLEGGIRYWGIPAIPLKMAFRIMKKMRRLL